MTTPVVLIHGFTGAASVWRPVVPLLDPQHDVHVLSVAGHQGGRECTDPSPEGLTTELERDLDELGLERAHLVGNSLGGWLALSLAARGRALSVVALSPAGGYEVGTRADRKVRALFVKNDIGLRLGKRLGLLDAVAARPRARARALADMSAHPERLSAAAARDLMRGAAECTISRAYGKSLKKAGYGELGPIDCPVRIAWAEHDRVLPYEHCSERLRRLVPHAQWTTLPGVGHVPMVDDPELVARTVLEETGRVDAQSAGAAARA